MTQRTRRKMEHHETLVIVSESSSPDRRRRYTTTAAITRRRSRPYADRRQSVARQSGWNQRHQGGMRRRQFRRGELNQVGGTFRGPSGTGQVNAPTGPRGTVVGNLIGDRPSKQGRRSTGGSKPCPVRIGDRVSRGQTLPGRGSREQERVKQASVYDVSAAPSSARGD